MGGKLIHNVNYADYLVLTAVQETVINGACDRINGACDRINKIAKCCGRDKNL